MSAATEKPSVIWFLRTTTLFEDTSESILDWAEGQSREVEFSRGDVLSVLGAGERYIFLVKDGQVKLRSFTESGKERILDVAGPGDTFGPLREVAAARRPIARGEPMANEAVALTAGLAYRFELDEFAKLVERRPTVALNVSRVLGLKQQQFEVRLGRLLYRSSVGKVAGLLSELADRYGDPQPDGTNILAFRLTHQEMASLIGLKRETVSEALALLESEDIVASRRGHFTILKPAELDTIL